MFEVVYESDIETNHLFFSFLFLSRSLSLYLFPILLFLFAPALLLISIKICNLWNQYVWSCLRIRYRNKPFNFLVFSFSLSLSLYLFPILPFLFAPALLLISIKICNLWDQYVWSCLRINKYKQTPSECKHVHCTVLRQSEPSNLY